MNFLSLTLAALAASCADSVDKAPLRGQVSTDVNLRHRQLTQSSSNDRQLSKQRPDKKCSSPAKCGAPGGVCCQGKQKGGCYSYCDSGMTCDKDDKSGNYMCKSLSIAPAALAPFCVPPTQTACEAMELNSTIVYDTCDNDCNCTVGETCQSCVKNCTTFKNHGYDEFHCSGMCHDDPTCCIEPPDVNGTTPTWCN